MSRPKVKSVLCECEDCYDLEMSSWTAFDVAWDAARKADEVAGRRYDRRIYAERAGEARQAVLEGAKHSVLFSDGSVRS